MKRRTLQKKLGLKKAQLDSLIEQGLPHDGDDFDEQKVIAWLAGKDAESKDTIIYDRAQAAAEFGVTKMTISNWENLPESPAQKGFYPVKAIREWKKNYKQGPRSQQVIEANTRVASLRADKLEHDLRVKRGEYILTEEVLNMLLRATSRQRSIIDAVPDKAVARLKSAGCPAKWVKVARELINESMTDLCRQVAQDLLIAQGDRDAEDIAAGE